MDNLIELADSNAQIGRMGLSTRNGPESPTVVRFTLVCRSSGGMTALGSILTRSTSGAVRLPSASAEMRPSWPRGTVALEFSGLAADGTFPEKSHSRGASLWSDIPHCGALRTSRISDYIWGRLRTIRTTPASTWSDSPQRSVSPEMRKLELKQHPMKLMG